MTLENPNEFDYAGLLMFMMKSYRRGREFPTDAVAVGISDSFITQVGKINQHLQGKLRVSLSTF